MLLKKLDDIDNNFGAKGEMLRKLYKLLSGESNVYIPKTLVLSLDYFERNIKDRLLKGNKQLLTEDEKKQILKEIRKTFGDKKVVIRSSASCEDSILFTNSGQYDSFLNLTKDKEIILAIEKTFLSFVSQNANEYYDINNIDINNQGMAVLIQEVAPVKQAGVMFTANPVTGEKKPIIEFCDGLGEDVVSGQKKVITIKDNYDYIPEALKKLLKIGNDIELINGMPQDIEWGVDDNDNIYIFQSRPIVFNRREKHSIYEIDIPKQHIDANVISNGFAIGEIKPATCYDNFGILLQSGRLTSKDLITIISSSSIILKTGGYLSHFANIIREFNKPSVLIDEAEELDLYKKYVIDAYNGYIYKFDDLDFDNQKKAYWNYIIDLLCNGNHIYLKSIGIKDYKINNQNDNNSVNEQLFTISNNKMNIYSENKNIEIAFDTIELLTNFANQFSKGDELNEKIYRRK